jgi:hypothetical protein
VECHGRERAAAETLCHVCGGAVGVVNYVLGQERLGIRVELERNSCLSRIMHCIWPFLSESEHDNDTSLAYEQTSTTE